MARDTIRISKRGGGVAASPASYLGPRFGRWLDCARGAGGRFDAAAKAHCFRVEQLPALVRLAEEAGFSVSIDTDLRERLQVICDQKVEAVQAATDRMERIDAVLAERGLALFPFQRDGVRWLSTRKAAILADEMGLGKTVQALIAIPHGARVVVICPASMKRVWEKECRRWRPDLVPQVLSGRGSFAWPRAGQVVITNWDILPMDAKQARKAVEQGKPVYTAPSPPAGTFIVADEAHKAKAPKALRTARFRALVKAVLAADGTAWELTATPMLNRPQELWCLLQNIDCAREVFGTWDRFISLMSGRKQRFGGYEFGTPDPIVGELLRRATLRRLKKDATGLPAKRPPQDLPVNDLTAKDRKELDKALETIKAALAEQGVDWATAEAEVLRTALNGGALFHEISRARACLAAAKTPAMVDLVESYEEAGEPVLVWSAHRAPIDLLAKRDGWAVITGDTPSDKRAAIQDEFQEGKLLGVGLTIAAGGEGLTLTRAAHAVFVDLAWTPALNSQAEDRIHRIGQDRSVLIRRLIATHPIDERLLDLLAEKSTIIEHSVERSVVKPGAVRDEAEELRATLKRVGVRPLPDPRRVASSRRGPETDQERWAAEALRLLTFANSDGCRYRNDIGWNATDQRIGHSLAHQLDRGLSPKQWALSIKICRKYHRQVGLCPAEKED